MEACDGNCKNCKVKTAAERLRPITRANLDKLRERSAAWKEDREAKAESLREKTKESARRYREMLRKEIVKDVKKAISPMLAKNVIADVKAEIEKVLDGIAEKKEEA